jgi:hypothetical protein
VRTLDLTKAKEKDYYLILCETDVEMHVARIEDVRNPLVTFLLKPAGRDLNTWKNSLAFKEDI